MMRNIRPIYGRGAAISCGHPKAAIAGWEILTQGGSVADAALAAATVLTVVLPQASTIGGDAFILYHDAHARKTFGINASGKSPEGLDARSLTQVKIERGPLSCTTPGIIAGWELLHAHFGKTPWATLFKNAIELAGSGFPASPGLASAAAAHRGFLEKDPGAAEIFLKHGPAKTGVLFRQEALAETLRTVAAGGARAFYRGRVAASVGKYIRSRGGSLAAADFSGCAADLVEPLKYDYRGLNVRVMPPNSHGLFMLLQLAALANTDLSRVCVDAPERYAALIAAAKSAFLAGDRSIADPAVVGSGIPQPLLEAGIDELRKDFRRHAGAALPNRGGTSVIAVADNQGNAAAIVQSVFLVFGSAVADPETGVLLNDRMLGFTLEKDHPNSVAASKRPAHTLNPVMTFDKDQLRHVLLTPGGPGQTLTLTQVLQATADHKLPLHEAVALSRWSMDLAGGVIVEPDMPETMLQSLVKLGVPVSRGAQGSPFFGSVECVERLPSGGMVAVADDRREAHAIAA